MFRPIFRLAWLRVGATALLLGAAGAAPACAQEDLESAAGELVDVAVIDQISRQMATTLGPALRARFEEAARESRRELDPERYAEFERAYLEAMQAAIEAMRPTMISQMVERMPSDQIRLLAETYRSPGVVEAMRGQQAYVVEVQPMSAAQVQAVVSRIVRLYPPASLYRP